MGLDIYAGTLTRYFAKNWKTATQQFAEENGLHIEFVRKHDVSPEDELSVDEIQDGMQKWSNAVVTALSHVGSFEVWEENNEKEYFADKPTWCAWGAMLLYGACVIYNQPLPQTIRKDWEWGNDPIVQRALEDKDRGWSLVSGMVVAYR